MDDVAFWGMKFASKSAKDEKYDLNKLPEVVRQVHLVAGIDATLANSSIQGWLGTHDGNWALEAVAALRRIGAVRSAKTFAKALEVFPKGQLPRDRAKREGVLYKLKIPEKFWSDLTDEYFDVADEEDVDGLLSSYIRKHAKLFQLDKMPPGDDVLVKKMKERLKRIRSPEELERTAAIFGISVTECSKPPKFQKRK